MPLSGPMTEASGYLHSGDSWVELWDVEINDTQSIQICAHTSAIVFDGKTYSPYWVDRSEDSVDVHGSVPVLTVTVGNLDNEISAHLATGDLLDRPAVRRLVNTALLGAAGNVITERYRIIDAEVGDFAVIFRVGLTNPLELPFPRKRHQRNRCGHVYGGDLCRYDTTRSGAIATCDFTLGGANGCKVHGDDEVANGLPRDHPSNYGGEPGIPKGPFR